MAVEAMLWKLVPWSLLFSMMMSGGEGGAPAEDRNAAAGAAPTALERISKLGMPETGTGLIQPRGQLHQLGDVYAAHGVILRSYDTRPSGIFMEVRRIGEHSVPLPESSLAALKQAIYQAMGGEFPLTISVYTLGEQPHMEGNVTGKDEKGRLLVVSTGELIGVERQMPEATWYRFADDAVLELDRKPVQPGDIPIGTVVRVWDEGVRDASYPGQATALRLEVTAAAEEHGDARGAVTAVENGREGTFFKYLIQVDGVKYGLPTWVQIRLDDRQVDVTEIKPGDTVRLWFAGYGLGPPQGANLVSQVVIER